jgi:uncharacterized protein (TIGR03067 family)
MMRLAAAVLFLFAGAAVADDAAAKKLLKDLEGSYKPTAMTRAGEAAPDEERKAVSEVIFKGDTITVRFEKEKKTEDHAATLVVDPAQKPIAIDMTPKEGPQAGRPVLGILKIEKDTVTICWADRENATDRPKEFSSTKGNKNFLIVLKKEK